MLPVILAPIVAKLAENGLNLLANAVTAKGKEFVEDKLGVNLDEPQSPEDLLKLKQLEIDHEEFLLEIGIKQSELNLKEIELDNANTNSARHMNEVVQTSEHASNLAKNAAYYIDFGIIGATLILAWFTFFQEIPKTNKELVYMALGSLLTMCGTILNFHRGTSSRSAKKDDTIAALSKGDVK